MRVIFEPFFTLSLRILSFSRFLELSYSHRKILSCTPIYYVEIRRKYEEMCGKYEEIYEKYEVICKRHTEISINESFSANSELHPNYIWRYERNMKKYKENMKKYVGIMKKYAKNIMKMRKI